ncbi:hypothetical protein HB943_05295 [Listeria weihenstephanensis]|uniref:GW domain-containing protein n=1 Tax=Listeria weihenstephanensis TaxID=1006155 RepID=A0A841Z2D8_9LIST|nr:GW dipeptide domain-containing protein [Listeria weihenstephanensis]MBC1500011.1 hypothetical protein [Listeria weihenstephanensis]
MKQIKWLLVGSIMIATIFCVNFTESRQVIADSKKEIFALGNVVKEYSVYQKPYGEKGNKITAKLKNYLGKQLTFRTIVMNRNGIYYKSYYQGKFLGYVDYRAVSFAHINYSDKSKVAYGTVKKNATVWFTVHGRTNKVFTDLNKYKNQNFRIYRELKNDHGSYYGVRFNDGKLGFVSTSAVTTFYDASMEKPMTAQMQLKNVNAKAYQVPVVNPTQDKGSLKGLQNKVLHVNAIAKTVNGTFYRIWYNLHDGNRWVNPTVGWVSEKDLKPIHDVTNDYKLLFNVPEQSNMQGFTYNAGIYYLAFDLSRAGYPNMSKIISYDRLGNKLHETMPMDVGHGAELSYYKGKIYVSNGNVEGAKVFVVDFEKGLIEKTFDFTKYGIGALATVRDDKTIILETSSSSDSNTANHVFSYINMENGSLMKRFQISNAWVTQGIDYYQGKIYFYTNDLITILNEQGKILDQQYLRFKGESEGLAIDKVTGKVQIGYNGNNRVYVQK